MSEEIRFEDVKEGVAFDLRVIPGARRDAIAGPYDGALKVRVSAPPERGKANKSVTAILANALGCQKRDIKIISGETSHNKRVIVLGLGLEEVKEKLGQKG